MLIQLTPAVAVAGQLDSADFAAVAAAGFVAVINNRPDGEAFDQPADADLRVAAAAAGLSYAAIAVDHSGFNREQVTAFTAVLTAASGPVLAFCRSGSRSAHLWALAEASRGGSADDVIAAAASGGFNVAGLRPTLVALAREETRPVA